MKEPEKQWQRWAPWVVVAIMAAWALGGMRPAKSNGDYDIEAFSKLPVLLNGRIQPIDSVAKNSLLVLRGKSTVLVTTQPQEELGFFDKVKLKKMSASEWLLEAAARPDDADTRHIFRIDNQEVLGLLKLPIERKFFSFNEIKPSWEEVEKQANRIGQQEIKPEHQSPFERELLKLNSALGLYFRIKNTFRPENVSNFTAELQGYEKSIPLGLVAMQQRQSGESYSEEDLQTMVQYFNRYRMLGRASYPLVVPPANLQNRDDWQPVGTNLMEAMRSGKIDPSIWAWAKIVDNYGQKKPAEFNQAVTDFRNQLGASFVPELRKGSEERFFNRYEPFIKSISIYLLAFLFGCAFWFTWARWSHRTAWYLLVLALVVHTSGLIFRMYLERRPPVTNLYSSAIFVGWGAVILGMILEKFWKDGIGMVTASAIGVGTLIIAHNLSLGGDTMEMLQAVLDTNFWLATHVVIITLGYSSMFLAGALATIYIIRGLFTASLPAARANGLARMVYGIFCFATLFSFVGTILGGIWADQSWGRFWGWDPKENGALLIVIWCATVLHARWGGMIKERGLMAMAIFGNMITSFSWFGVNMLGVGLHTYGFMDKAFKYLLAYNVLQVVLIALALVPMRYWKSMRAALPKAKQAGSSLGSAKPAAA